MAQKRNESSNHCFSRRGEQRGRARTGRHRSCGLRECRLKKIEKIRTKKVWGCWGPMSCAKGGQAVSVQLASLYVRLCRRGVVSSCDHQAEPRQETRSDGRRTGLQGRKAQCNWCKLARWKRRLSIAPTTARCVAPAGWCYLPPGNIGEPVVLREKAGAPLLLWEQPSLVILTIGLL